LLLFFSEVLGTSGGVTTSFEVGLDHREY